MSTVFVDYAGREAVAAMRLGGMSIVERVLREAAQAGATRALVRLAAAARPALPTLALAVEFTDGDAPADARPVAGDVIAGVTIADGRSRRRAERALLQACRRSYDGLGDTYVIRPVSLRLTPWFARAGLTPNQITVANTVVGALACALVAWGGTRGTAGGGRAALALGGAAIFLQVVLDSCDGELARVRHLYSSFGRTLDNVSDDVIDIGMTLALGWAVGGWWWPVAIVSAVARASCAAMIFRAVARIGKPGDVLAFRWFFDRAEADLADRFEHKLTPLAVLRAFGRRDVYTLVWAVCGFTGVLLPGLILGLIVAFGYFGLSIVHRVVRARTPAAQRAGM
ncbi:MAG: CDP-alcohol phosphatidyltransferase family protein [Myxococcales bacterium]|nr:CDP-alcohol phosphatidyltransferase family protein [Myxococcales bacterium]MBK7194388.1 CDP-alcohol phosphatidyltransferase family protein [Myxococcales bacterium]